MRNKKADHNEVTGLEIVIKKVPEKGVEPSRHCWHTSLKRTRLPIPPFGLIKTPKLPLVFILFNSNLKVYIEYVRDEII